MAVLEGGMWKQSCFTAFLRVSLKIGYPPIPADSDNRCRQVTFAVYKNFDDINEEEIQVKNCLWLKHV